MHTSQHEIKKGHEADDAADAPSFRPKGKTRYRGCIGAVLLALTFGSQAIACDSGLSVDSVSSNGAIVVLDDGSVWAIEAGDQVDTSLWLPMTDITACDDKLINTEDGEVADAEQIR